MFLASCIQYNTGRSPCQPNLGAFHKLIGGNVSSDQEMVLVPEPSNLLVLTPCRLLV